LRFSTVLYNTISSNQKLSSLYTRIFGSVKVHPEGLLTLKVEPLITGMNQLTVSVPQVTIENSSTPNNPIPITSTPVIITPSVPIPKSNTPKQSVILPNISKQHQTTMPTMPTISNTSQSMPTISSTSQPISLTLAIKS
jgi:hypothetical protein